MKLIVAGCRTITDEAVVAEAIERWVADHGEPTEVVHGDAKGVDRLAGQWAHRNKVPGVKFPADWNRFGRRAGPVRNSLMAGYADALLAIWDGKSRGTANMIRQAKERGLVVEVRRVAPPKVEG